MTTEATKTGKELECHVADAYRALGARKVEHDVEIAGHQIDVYAELEAADRSLHRIAVEAKDYTKPVGIQIVRDFADVVDTLRRRGLADEGVIVSPGGYSRQARNAAKEHGLRLLEPADLGVTNLAQMRADYLAARQTRFEYLDLGGIAPRVQNRTVKLRMADVFVPLQARPEIESRWDVPDFMAGMPEHEDDADLALRFLARTEREAKPVDIPELLRKPRVVVLGDPGCGKSTLLRHVAYAVATGDTVQPLPPERIAEFVEKWYAAIEREAGEAEWSDEIRERAEELSETIQARPGIHRLAENPLLLTIIALVNWRGRKLPNRRVELYAHAAETLIESWPYRRQGVVLATERVIRLLSPVATRIFSARSAGDIAEDELLPVLADAICRVDGADRREAAKYAREFLFQVSEHSGIFRERGFDDRNRRVFGFLHLTVAEYFTARYLAGLWEGLGDDAEARRAFLRKYVHVPRWREVVLLMAGDVGHRDNDRAERATRLLGDILQLGSDYEEHLHRDLLLAGECLADDLRVQPKTSQ